jgi:predicted RNase H-like HicB family nuclease
MSRVELTLRAIFYVEDDQWIGFCPDLNVSTQGDTREEAEVNLHEAVGLFIETCADLGSLEKVLREAGLIPVQQATTFQYPLPHVLEESLKKPRASTVSG